MMGHFSHWAVMDLEVFWGWEGGTELKEGKYVL